MIRKWKKFPFSWLLPVLFFAALWLLGTTGIYNDSNQYIAMHIHREPLYSFFLWIFRSLFGETKYLDIVRFLQNGLAAFSVIWLAESLKKRFDFGQWMEALVCLILLAPHIITPVFSASAALTAERTAARPARSVCRYESAYCPYPAVLLPSSEALHKASLPGADR